MLVSFAAENFLSFAGQAELSMIPSRGRTHPEHVFRDSSSGTNLLRAAVLYGANASGKSNFVRALHTLHDLVVEGTQKGERIPVVPFKLGRGTDSVPTRFRIVFRTVQSIFVYELVVDSVSVHWESLVRIVGTREEMQYEREQTSAGEYRFELGPKLLSDLSDEDRQFVRFVARGTRANQAFLAESIDRNVGCFSDAADWFRDSLMIITPDSEYAPLEQQLSSNPEFQRFVASVLSAAGTGIEDINVVDVDLALKRVPHEVTERLQKLLPSGTSAGGAMLRGVGGARIAFVVQDGELRPIEVRTVRSSPKGPVEFDFEEESDGTRRLFDLVPGLYDLMHRDAPVVYVVDEIERSLHPNLTRFLISRHLHGVDSTRMSQLIATTHETDLLDLNLLRRDEIWFVEKTREGASQLYSLVDYAPRYDKAIRRDYLIGRFGAIPFLGAIAPAHSAVTSDGED